MSDGQNEQPGGEVKQAEQAAGDTVTTPAAEAAPAGAMESPAPGDKAVEEQAAPAIELADLRQALAGGNESLLKQLGRYKTAESIGKAFWDNKTAAQQKQQPLSAPGEDASEEQLATWREAVGIPEEAKDYPVAWREGYEPSDADNEILEGFKGFLHERNIDPKAAQASMDWYQDFAAEQQQARDGAMAQKSKETQTHFRGVYGAEYDGNMAAAMELVRTQLGEDGVQSVLTSRLEDGTRLQDQPWFVEMMVNLGTDYYGSNQIFTGDVETTAKTVDQKLEEYMKMRLEDEDKYFSPEIQEEVAKLKAQQQRLAERQKG